jgi:hypothetical protein
MSHFVRVPAGADQAVGQTHAMYDRLLFGWMFECLQAWAELWTAAPDACRSD